jgi:hypothetical protein
MNKFRIQKPIKVDCSLNIGTLFYDRWNPTCSSGQRDYHYFAKIAANNYPDTPLQFQVDANPDVNADPNTVDMSHPKVTMTVFAKSPTTHEQINGKVFASENINGDEIVDKEIGDTNKPFQYTFKRNYIDTGLPSGRVHTFPPTVTVKVPGYDDTKVPIKFTNLRPPFCGGCSGGGGALVAGDNGNDAGGCPIMTSNSTSERRPICNFHYRHLL